MTTPLHVKSSQPDRKANSGQAATSLRLTRIAKSRTLTRSTPPKDSRSAPPQSTTPRMQIGSPSS
jgi:hypothetical protein